MMKVLSVIVDSGSTGVEMSMNGDLRDVVLAHDADGHLDRLRRLHGAQLA
jgi:hypothetical protein